MVKPVLKELRKKYKIKLPTNIVTDVDLPPLRVSRGREKQDIYVTELN